MKNKDHIPVWMDVDTGTDDAVAIIALHALEALDIQGLSTVCGNCGLENAYRNTRTLNTVLGTSYPVYRGAEGPLLRERVHAADVHGKNGLGNVELPLPQNETVYPEHAWDALYEAAKKLKGELRLITTGPLTNIAIAFTKYPDLPGLLKSINMMGGATMEGNVTPCAEFNIYADPEAADAVFKAGVPIVMCPLDVTEKAVLTPEDLEEIRSFGNEAGKFVYEMLQKPWSFHKAMGHEGVQMHDSYPVLYFVYPDMFTGEDAGVVVETKSDLTLGKTVTDLYSDKQFDFKNAFVLLDVDRELFRERLKSLIKSVR